MFPEFYEGDVYYCCQEDGFPVEKVCKEAGFIIKMGVKECHFCDTDFGGGNEGGGCRAQAVEDAVHCFISSEPVQHGGYSGDDDESWGGEGKGADDAAQSAGSEVACIGGHIDAKRAGAGFSDGDDVCHFLLSEPFGPLSYVIEEGHGGKAASDREEACFEKFPDDECKKDHFFSPFR